MDRNAERLGRLSPEEKVALAIDMTQACVSLSINGIKAENPEISKEELLLKLRERLDWAKRHRDRKVFPHGDI